MKQIVFFIIFLVGLSTSAFAQFSLGAHVAPAFPLGTFGNTAQTGFGFDVEGRYQTSGPFMASASIGFQSFDFAVAGVSSSDVSYNITPITFSLLYALSEGALQPYVGMGVGINRVAVEVFGFNTSDSHFGVSPAFGLQYAVNDQVHFDANVRYQFIFANNNANNVVNFNDNISYIPFYLGVFYTFGM